jgi:hypothetical protein
MTKADMIDNIEFALSELADVLHDLRLIQEIPQETPRPGELRAEAEARIVGRCQGMAHNAEMFLGFAVGNLRQCLTDPNKPIAPFMTTRNASTRTSNAEPAADPNSATEDLPALSIKRLKQRVIRDRAVNQAIERMDQRAESRSKKES